MIRKRNDRRIAKKIQAFFEDAFESLEDKDWSLDFLGLSKLFDGRWGMDPLPLKCIDKPLKGDLKRCQCDAEVREMTKRN